MASCNRLLGLCLVASVAPALGSSFHVDYATYLGGPKDEVASRIAVDSAGAAYVAGTQASLGSEEVFVTKLNPAGTGVVWSILLPAASANGIAVDPAGNAYVLTSDSNGASTVTKIAGGTIGYSKAVGASGASIAADSGGNAYITGSAGEGLPVTPGTLQPSLAAGTCHGGAGVGMIPFPCPDAFAMKINPVGDIVYATYLGGSGPDQGRGIAVDGQGQVWITGDTVSQDFPVTADALDSQFSGEVDLGPLRFGDAFVAKLDATGSKLLYSTYLNGAGPQAGFGVAVDGAGSAYVAGGNQSLPYAAGYAFVAKLSASGQAIYSRVIAGQSASGIAVDVEGQAYVAAAGYLSILDPSGTAVVNSAPLLGSFCQDGQGAVYFAGRTTGFLFFPTEGAYQTQFGGGTYDATVTKIDFGPPPSPWVGAIVNAASLQSGTPSFYPVFDVAPGELITVFGSGFDLQTRVLFDGVVAPILFASPNQINAMVPFETAGPTTAVSIQGDGQTLGPATMNVFDAVPGLFTADGSGTGQLAALNEDGTVNAPGNPVPRGSVVTLFLTGTGRITAVGCSLGQVLSVGAGQMQVRIGQDVTPGDRVPVTVYVGNYASQFGPTTVAVR